VRHAAARPGSSRENIQYCTRSNRGAWMYN
jgi:hypothetical protein